ncbi:unnamed protein product, partial [Mesorhabditis belari]|uniref:LisH domain-containing protein n=1 Tax=Mesorhabditis belari TaxID=2138241 RepID=A0AAF3F5U1_9BILA
MSALSESINGDGGASVDPTMQIDIADQALSPELLQRLIAFCRKNNLQQTEEALAREAGLTQGNAPGGLIQNEKIMADFASFLNNIEGAYDVLQAELSLLLFPVFAHSYLKLLFDVSPSMARTFYERFHLRIPRAYEEQVIELSRCTFPEIAKDNELVQLLKSQHFTIRISKTCNAQLDQFIQRNATLRTIMKERIMVENTDLLSKNRLAVEWQMGGLLGHPSLKEQKKHKVLYAVAREDSPYVDKRKLKTKESKDKKREQMVPTADRIPLPLSDVLRLERVQMQKEASTRMTYVNADHPPSICCFTALNAGSGVSSCDVSDDTSIIALGMGDSVISLYAVDETKQLKQLKEADELDKIDLETEPELLRDLIYDDASACKTRTLGGHSGPVYSLNFDPCKRLLISSAADSTIRLWSVDTFRNVVVHRLSRPVWDVKFCSRGFYFCTGGADRTATVWSTDRVHPLRIFPDCYGHVTCVDYHPNCNYIAGGSDDRYVRLWDVLSGACVRTFSGHKTGIRGIKVSPCGRYIVSIGGDGALCVWDIATQRMIAAETRTMPTIMASIQFTREGDTFAVSHGTSSITLYSLEALIRNHGHQDNSIFEPKINPDGFQIFHYPTKTTPVVGLHWTRRNLLLGIGSFMQ